VTVAEQRRIERDRVVELDQRIIVRELDVVGADDLLPAVDQEDGLRAVGRAGEARPGGPAVARRAGAGSWAGA